MTRVKKTPTNVTKRRVRPALDPDVREQQLIGLAIDLVEQRLRDGTASSQETTHFLKLGSSRNRLEQSKLEEENKLLRAKTESIQAAKDSSEMYEKAIKSLIEYKGLEGGVIEDEFDDEY